MEQIILAFVTGLTTGGLSCLAVQGGLLASSIAHEVEGSILASPVMAQGRRPRTAAAVQPTPVRAGRPIALFLAAKLAAYTVLGFLLGLLGSVLQLTPLTRAILQAAIGVFMIGTALRMFNVHPIFRYFALEPPRAVTRFIRRQAKGEASAVTPLFLGALTVLIPCGVTQAMLAVAMGSGSPVTGATIMFAFTLGTSPVFFAVAYLATRLGARLEKSFMRIVAIAVLILGLISVDAGLTLAGWPYSITNLRMGLGAAQATEAPGATQPAVPAPAAQGGAADQDPISGALATDADGVVVTINVKDDGYFPAVARAKAGQAVKLVMVTKDTYSCARALVVPSLRIEKVLPATGSVVIDIPPQPAGSKLFYSCSMGMYSGVIAFEG